MILTTFTLIELATASVAVLGALGVCLVRVIGQTEQSRCSKVNCFCLSCDREPPIQMNIPSQITPHQLELIEHNSDFDEALQTIPRK